MSDSALALDAMPSAPYFTPQSASKASHLRYRRKSVSPITQALSTQHALHDMTMKLTALSLKEGNSAKCIALSQAAIRSSEQWESTLKLVRLIRGQPNEIQSNTGKASKRASMIPKSKDPVNASKESLIPAVPSGRA